MEKEVDIESLIYGPHDMHAGFIMNGMERSEFDEAISSLRSVLDKKSDAPNRVLFCKEDMFKRISDLLPPGSFQEIEEASLFTPVIYPEDKWLCVVIKNSAFPEHYLLMTSLDEIHDFIYDNNHPVAGIIAVKGFTKKEFDSLDKYEGFDSWTLFPVVMKRLRAVEFATDAHNPPAFAIVHSSMVQMHLEVNGAIKNEMLYGSIPIKMKPNKNNRDRIYIRFRNGYTAAFVNAEDHEKLNLPEGNPTLTDRVKSGTFGL